MSKKITEKQLREIIRESLDELSDRTMGTALRKMQHQRRDRQAENTKQSILAQVRSKYGFSAKTPEGEFDFFPVYVSKRDGFAIEVSSPDFRGEVTLMADPNFKYMTTDGKSIEETPIGYAIDNLRAYERKQYQELRRVIIELNRESWDDEHESLQESKLKKIIRESVRRVLKESHNFYQVNVTTQYRGNDVVGEEAYVTKCEDGRVYTGTHRGTTYDDGFDSTEYGIFYGTEDECQKYADEINGGK